MIIFNEQSPPALPSLNTDVGPRLVAAPPVPTYANKLAGTVQQLQTILPERAGIGMPSLPSHKPVENHLHQSVDGNGQPVQQQQLPLFQPLFYQTPMLNGFQQQQRKDGQMNGLSGGGLSVGMNGSGVKTGQTPLREQENLATANNDLHPLPGAWFYEVGSNGPHGDGDSPTFDSSPGANSCEQTPRGLLSPLHLQLQGNHGPLMGVGAYPGVPRRQQSHLGCEGQFGSEEFHLKMSHLTLGDQSCDLNQQPHVTETVEVPSSEHVAEIVGRQGNTT